MALAFVQLSAVLIAMNISGHYPKMHMALVVRQWLRKIWAELDLRAQGFFAELVGVMQALFEAGFAAWVPRWGGRYNAQPSLRECTQVSLGRLDVNRPLPT